MKKILGPLTVLALAAAPVFAEFSFEQLRQRAIPASALGAQQSLVADSSARALGDGVVSNEPYDMIPASANPGHGTGGPGSFFLDNNDGVIMGDDVHIRNDTPANGGNVTGFGFVYSDDRAPTVSGGPQTHSSLFFIWNNAAVDTASVWGGSLYANLATFATGPYAGSPAIILANGFYGATATNPVGGWLFTLTGLPVLNSGKDLWWGALSGSPNPTRRGLRGLSQSAPGFPIGSSHNNMLAATTSPLATSQFAGPLNQGGTASLGNLRLGLTPEPTAAALLCLGGLAMLRRRRA